MSYFDHVRCTACRAHIDPENLAVVPGQGMSCPRCNAPLSAGDLFGLKDAFVGMDDEDGNDLSLDDLFSGSSSTGSGGARARARSSPRPRGTASREIDEDSGGEGPSALEAMRSLKK